MRFFETQGESGSPHHVAGMFASSSLSTAPTRDVAASGDYKVAARFQKREAFGAPVRTRTCRGPGRRLFEGYW